jgi:hypothetical protein
MEGGVLAQMSDAMAPRPSPAIVNLAAIVDDRNFCGCLTLIVYFHMNNNNSIDSVSIDFTANVVMVTNR